MNLLPQLTSSSNELKSQLAAVAAAAAAAAAAGHPLDHSGGSSYPPSHYPLMHVAAAQAAAAHANSLHHLPYGNCSPVSSSQATVSTQSVSIDGSLHQNQILEANAGICSTHLFMCYVFV